MCSQTRFFQLGLSGFLSFALIFLSSCNAEMSEICGGKYDHSVTDVISKLETRTKSDSVERHVASLNGVSLKGEAPVSGPILGIDQDEREHWQSWSQSELKRVEAYLDWMTLHHDEVLENDKTRRHLTDIANRLVAFHGYAHDGRVSRMLTVLRSVEEDRKVVQALVCRNP